MVCLETIQNSHVYIHHEFQTYVSIDDHLPYHGFMLICHTLGLDLTEATFENGIYHGPLFNLTLSDYCESGSCHSERVLFLYYIFLNVAGQALLQVQIVYCYNDVL